MTERDQVRHLLRRFGFGAGPTEAAEYERLGVEGAIDRLVGWRQVDEGFPISPWEICFEPDKPDMYFDPPRIGAWWALRMLLTRRPLQENLTLFWHNHFAVGADKIEFGPSMARYVDAMRVHGGGPFAPLLAAVSTTPAMIKWLDTDTNVKGHPNENFARELFELFTLGIGNYNEADVKAAAKSFTGWGLRYLVFEPGAENLQETARAMVKSDTPMIAFCITPELHDATATDPFVLLKDTAARPETAKRIAHKLWSWYAYEDPEPAVVDRVAATISRGSIQDALRQIATMPEFWGPKSVRQKVKSPADFIIGILRQSELGPALLGMRPTSAKNDTPLAKPLRDVGGLLWYLMYQQGLQLLYPPDVGGWHWGRAWLTSQNLAERMKFPDLIFGVSQPDKAMTNFLRAKILAESKPSSPSDVVEALLDRFDIEFESAKRAILVKACTDAGGVDALHQPESAAKVLSGVCRLIFSSPEFQMC